MNLLRKLQNLIALLLKIPMALGMQLLQVLEVIDSYLWRCLHAIVQGAKSVVIKSVVAFTVISVIMAKAFRGLKFIASMPLRAAKLTLSILLAVDRSLWKLIMHTGKASRMAISFVIESFRKIVNAIVHAGYGFIWVAMLPYNSAMVGGKFLSLSYNRTGNYVQEMMQKIAAFFARIWGIIRILFDNIKHTLFDKEQVRQMWESSNAKVDAYVEEGKSLFQPGQGEPVIPESASLYVKNKSIFHMALMRLYARIHLFYKSIVRKFENIVSTIAFEYHRIMTTPEKGMESVHSPVYRAINNRPNRALMVMFVSMASLFTLFIVWASFFEIARHVHAIGRIETYDQLQTITAFDGAIIEKVMVEEDQAVQKGQELIRFDDTVYKARYNDMQEKYYTRLGNIAVLEARIAGTHLNLDSSIKEFSPRIYADLEASYNAGLNVNDTNLTVIDSQIAHKEKEISDAKKDQSLYVENLDLVGKQVDILTKLAANELVSKLRMIDAQKEMLTTKMKLKAVENELLRAESDLKGLQDRRANYVSNFHKDMLSELAGYRNDLSSAVADMAAAKTQLGRSIVVSPIDGAVYKISNKAVPGHTVSGQDVISIVPSGGGLVMTGLVLPSEIGFIKKGQKVGIKVATYDYSIYGKMNGVVERISPETIQNKTDGIYYYEVVVKSENNYLEHKGRKFYIKPGMDASAEFELGYSTLMKNILDPFLKTMNGALSGL